MITRIRLNNFKNFKHEDITLSNFNNEQYHFSVLIGRNGSGKSCILEAIEYCLCGGIAKEMRASSMKEIVNSDSGDRNMSVCLELSRDYQGRLSYIYFYVVPVI